MSADNDQFARSCKMFRDYLSKCNYPINNLTYYQWCNADVEDQAVLLFVRFYNSVTLAWYTAITSRDIAYVESAEGVSTVLQYLMKNVPLIKQHPGRFNSNYIYRVCYNCLGCLPRVLKAQLRDSSEIPNEIYEDDMLINLWDLAPAEDEDPEILEIKSAIWDIIHHMGPKAEKVVNHLINPSDSLDKTSPLSKEYHKDALAEVSVTEQEFADILEELRVRLAPFKGAFQTI